jgi:hypothetical protein
VVREEVEVIERMVVGNRIAGAWDCGIAVAEA